jgi:acetyltransferase-like isoleucine patch superfamily enzyme
MRALLRAILRPLVTFPGSARATKLRGRVYRLAMRETVGPSCRLGRHVEFQNPEQIELGRGVILHNNVMLIARPPEGDRVPRITVGEKTFMNVGSIVAAGHRIDIGADVMFGPNVCVVDQDHAFGGEGAAVARQGMTDRGPIEIGDGCWIATGAVVLGGTRIPAGSVVAANSVVRGHFDTRCVLAGAPARVVKEL